MIFKGIIWLAEKISDAVDSEITQRRDALMGDLRELHRSLESGQMTEEDFERSETTILNALDDLDRISKSRGLS